MAGGRALKKRQKPSRKESHQRELTHTQSSTNGNQKAKKQKIVSVVHDGQHILIHQHGPDAPPIVIGTEDPLLPSVLYPLTEEDFFQNVWKKKAYVSKPSPGTGTERLSDLISNHMSDLDLDTLLRTTASEAIFVWMRPLEAIVHSVQKEASPLAEEMRRIDSFELSGEQAVDSAKICYGSGASLYFRSSPELSDILVPELTGELGINFSGFYANGDAKGEIEVFMSRKGHVTDWHFDFMENFTFQLKGSKKWKIKKSGISHPLRGATSHYKNVDTLEQQLKTHHIQDPNFSMKFSEDDYEEVILTEGCFFYHPAGIWHRVECGEDSISINVSLIASSLSDIVSEGVRHLIGIDFRNFRQAKEKLRSLLPQLIEDLSTMQAEDFLPNSLWRPRHKSYDFADLDVDHLDLDTKVAQIHEESSFKRNPIAVLVPLSQIEEEEEEEEDSARYTLHVNFGNEELASAVEVKMTFPVQICSLVDWLRVQRKTFTFSQLLQFARDEEKRNRQSMEDAEGVVTNLLKLLTFNGYIQHQMEL
ncbi:hypothetical protein PROFUN_06752 [Planoprotostelium fungivorum]|uniref:JmjC domain-containing protein n=1 Tax=Planoprotostelium fungivorum TaxID=1890364 RepID=A0A2P6NNI6_9EUKA|nr:hypothetical protein PROFUN_06752 [Planoprotostelium fungivorum]